VVVAEDAEDSVHERRFADLDFFLTEAEAVAHGKATGERVVDEKLVAK
jgi:hypothetical protein